MCDEVDWLLFTIYITMTGCDVCFNTHSGKLVPMQSTAVAIFCRVVHASINL